MSTWQTCCTDLQTAVIHIFRRQLFNYQYIQSSKQQLFSLYFHTFLLEMWASCFDTCLYLTAPLSDDKSRRQTDPATPPFFNYVFSQFINSSNLLFVHTFLHQSLYFVRKHFKQRFALFFTFWQGFDQTHSSMLNSYYGNVYWHYNPIINTVQLFSSIYNEHSFSYKYHILVQTVNLTINYVHKTKGVFFVEHTIVL